MAAPYLVPLDDSRAGLRVISDEAAPAYDGESQERTAPFVMIDSAAGEEILGRHGPSAFAVYFHLCRRAKDGKCWPSFEDISDATTLSRTHVIRMLKVLEDGGWIAKEPRVNQWGRSSSNVYTILEKPQKYGGNIARTSREHRVTIEASQMAPEQDLNKNQTRVEPEDKRTPPLSPTKTAKRAAAMTTIPDDFEVTPEMRQRAKDRYALTDAEIDAKTERFRTWVEAKGQKYAKWDAGWLNFMEPKAWDQGPNRNGYSSRPSTANHAGEDREYLLRGEKPIWGSAQGGIDSL